LQLLAKLPHHQDMHASVAKCARLIFLIVLSSSLSASLLAQNLVGEIRSQISQGSLSGAESQLQTYKASHGVTPEYLEALSWMARGAAAAGNWTQATAYATATKKLSEQQLQIRKLDAEPHLALALGAAYEVLAQAMEAKGEHAQAVSLLRAAIVRYGSTSIKARLQKNLNLIAMVGQTAPALQEAQFLGPKPPTLASVKGMPVLLFFWAHWCIDCKGEAPIIARLKQEFSPEGLVVIGPTQFYGYAAQGNEASPDQERAYIESVRERYYSSLQDMPVPLSKQNFNAYGASTTPTLVVLNRDGKVAMYHPGALSYDDLRAAVQKAVAR
jgi:thiol-disulfide isomerase/thioredoxin